MAINLNMNIVGNAGSVFTMFRGVGKELDGLERKGATTFDKVAAVGKKALLGTSVAAIGFGAATVKMAGDFQSSLTQLQTGAGESAANMSMVGKGVLSMAGDVGSSTSQLVDGLYHIESAGFHGAQGLNVLRVAAEGAKVGNADLDVMGKTLVGTMNSYGMAGDKATSMMNQLIATTASGDMRMEDLASSLGNVTPIAAAAGVSFAQVGGAIATMTAQNMSAQQASQDLANLIRSMQNPTEVATKAMAAMGLNSVDVAKDLGQKGLTGTLEELTTAITKHMGPSGLVLQDTFNQSKTAMSDANTMLKALPASIQGVAQQLLNGSITSKQWTSSIKGMSVEQANQAKQFATVVKHASGFNDLIKAGGPAAQTYTATLAEMTGGATGLNTSLMLTGPNAKVFADNVKNVGDAASKSGKDVNGWSVVQKTFNQQLAEAKGHAEALGIKIGTALLPAAEAILRTTMSLVTWLGRHKTIALILAGVIGGALTAAMAVYVAHLTISAITTTKETYAIVRKNAALVASKIATVATSVATKAAAAAQWLFNAAMDANPIMLVVLALVALAVGVYEAYQHITGFRQVVQAAFRAVAAAGKFMWNDVLKPTWSALVTAFKWVGREAKSLWQDDLEPAFRAIGRIVAWVYQNMIKPVFSVLLGAFHIAMTVSRELAEVTTLTWNSIAETVAYAWNNILNPILSFAIAVIRFGLALEMWILVHVFEAAWQAIAGIAKLAWNNVLKPTWDAVIAAVRAVGDAVMWLWHHAFEPAWHGVEDAAKWAYEKVLKPVWGALIIAVQAVGDAGVWLWRHVFEPAWHGIGEAVSFVWNRVLKPTWADLLAGIDDVKKAGLWLWHNVFEPVWKGIGDAVSFAWNHVIKPIFDTIKNAIGDIVNGFDKIVNVGKGVLGGATDFLNKASGGLFHFADGGPVPGPKGQPMLAVVHGGEYVLSNDMLSGRASPSTSLAGGGSLSGASVTYVYIDAGTIIHENDLATTIQTAMTQQGGRNSTSYTPYASSRNRSS